MPEIDTETYFITEWAWTAHIEIDGWYRLNQRTYDTEASAIAALQDRAEDGPDIALRVVKCVVTRSVARIVP